MWALMFVAFFQISAASAASPVDLELLLNRGLQSFIEPIEDHKVSNTTRRNGFRDSSVCDKATAEEDDVWNEAPED
ncbi:MAG: hypothetical protein K2W94_07270 [Alphaproteobacteria bacterium]|nr:hypothetical protein [Alphaproteobacteria bacterium]